jgi:antigen flippase
MAFVPVAVVSAVGLPMLQLLIRDNLVSHSGMQSVGLLQGVMRISDMYLGIATSLFALYYFPRFSELLDAGAIVREMTKGLLLIVPAVGVVSLAIYLVRDWIIRIVFTHEFTAMRDLFGWQMLGNTLKIASWMFAYFLLAKANALAMAALEIATLVVWWALSIYLIGRNGPVGATQAYAATYALYSVVTLAGVAYVIARIRAGNRTEQV